MDVSITDQDGSKLEITLGSDVFLADYDSSSDNTLARFELSRQYPGDALL